MIWWVGSIGLDGLVSLILPTTSSARRVLGLYVTGNGSLVLCAGKDIAMCVELGLPLREGLEEGFPRMPVVWYFSFVLLLAILES